MSFVGFRILVGEAHCQPPRKRVGFLHTRSESFISFSRLAGELLVRQSRMEYQLVSSFHGFNMMVSIMNEIKKEILLLCVRSANSKEKGTVGKSTISSLAKCLNAIWLIFIYFK